jgi:hypothetical protein
LSEYFIFNPNGAALPLTDFLTAQSIQFLGGWWRLDIAEAFS